jgi:hypothetical protein
VSGTVKSRSEERFSSRWRLESLLPEEDTGAVASGKDWPGGGYGARDMSPVYEDAR